MKERCRDGCRTSLLIAGVVLVLAIFHTSLPLCHPYIIIHFMEMIFSTCIGIAHRNNHSFLSTRSLAGGAMFITTVIAATVIFVTLKGTSNISECCKEQLVSESI